MKEVLRGAALALALAQTAPAREVLRLPWVFSDEPDLAADFQFQPGPAGQTEVQLMIGGRFAGFGLPRGAVRAPRLAVRAEFTAPGQLTVEPRSAGLVLDLAEVLSEYGLEFDRRHFSSRSSLVYKGELALALPPGDYNVTISLQDPDLEVSSRRTLHLIVPAFASASWELGDLKFIKGVGEKLDAKGKAQRVLDPDPWRQFGPRRGWDLMAAYSDRGPRPAGPLRRRHWMERLREEDPPAAWSEEGELPAKQAGQSWLVKVPEAALKGLQPGVYILRAKVWARGREGAGVSTAKTFEVLP